MSDNWQHLECSMFNSLLRWCTTHIIPQHLKVNDNTYIDYILHVLIPTGGCRCPEVITWITHAPILHHPTHQHTLFWHPKMVGRCKRVTLDVLRLCEAYVTKLTNVWHNFDVRLTYFLYILTYNHFAQLHIFAIRSLKILFYNLKAS